MGWAFVEKLVDEVLELVDVGGEWRTRRSSSSFTLIHEAFTPTAPNRVARSVRRPEAQLDKVVRAVLQRGEHAILYGERGVGKTSLVSTLFDLLVWMGNPTTKSPVCNALTG